jgi:ADP-ribose pyrophosphatase YjhB (NUDIX family)
MENRSKKSRCIIVNDGKVLLCRTVDLIQDYYFFPGGSLMGNESPEELLKREMREEFDCELAGIRHLTTIKNDFEHRGVNYGETIEMFQAKLVGDELKKMGKITLQDAPNIIAQWISLEEIKAGKIKILPSFDYLSLIR